MAQIKSPARFTFRSACLKSPVQVMEHDYKVKLEVFEGPLDLLLFLIKRDEIDIYDISIERITRQYLEYLQAFKELNIDLAGEFVVMAANLIYLKSRSLLPADLQPPPDEAEEDDPRWDLIRQLIEYKKFKEAAAQLHLRELEQERIFARAEGSESGLEADAAPAGRSRHFPADSRISKCRQAGGGARRFAGHFRRTLHRFGQDRNDPGPDGRRRPAAIRRFIFRAWPRGSKWWSRSWLCWS